MNNKFSNRLEEYLSTECDDYSMKYEWRWDDDMSLCVVTIKIETYTTLSKEIYFRYDEKNNTLLIELSEGSWYSTEEYDPSVKYFWMLVAPALFPE